MVMLYPQALNQEFFYCGGVLFKLGHLDKYSLTTQERKVLQGKKSTVFCIETLKNFILNEKFYS